MKCPVDQIKYYEIGSDTIKAKVMNYGCTLLNLWIKVNNEWRDVVLGYEEITDYFDNPPCFGSCVIPNANRIEGAQFTLDGITYQLDKNDGDNNLHSGFEPLHKRLWYIVEHTENSITFRAELNDGECGMPGNRKYTVIYSIEDNHLCISYGCTSDVDTLFNPTNHSYFNLLGHDSGDILAHKLMINANTFSPSDDKSICHGEIIDVHGTPMDFTTPTEIGQRINEDYDQLIWGKGYDHNYLLNDNSSKPEYNLTTPAATLIAPDNSLSLHIYTTAPCMQIYTGNYLSESDVGKSGYHYAPRYGVALETQYMPNAINVSGVDAPILRAGTIGRSATVYEFT